MRRPGTLLQPINPCRHGTPSRCSWPVPCSVTLTDAAILTLERRNPWLRSEEHTSELQSHSDLHSFPTRRSSDQPMPPWHPFPVQLASPVLRDVNRCSDLDT